VISARPAPVGQGHTAWINAFGPTRSIPSISLIGLPRFGIGLALILVLCTIQPLQAQHRLGYYVELGGTGGFASFNVDWRVAGHLHLRGGVGDLLWPTAPFTASYVFGGGRSGLEIGGGATVFFFPERDASDSFGEQLTELLTIGKGVGTVALAGALVGYRHEKPSGSIFRVTLTPFVGHDKIAAWLGVSFGGAF